MIHGIKEQKPETKERLYQTVRKFFKEQLGLEYADRVLIDTVHRTPYNSTRDDDRAIVIAFVCRDDLYHVLSRGRQLQNTPYRMNTQAPPELRERRRELFDVKKHIKEQDRDAIVTIKKGLVIQDGAVVYDQDKERARNPPRYESITKTARKLVTTHSNMSKSYAGSHFMGHFVPLDDAKLLHPALVVVRGYEGVASASHTIWVLKVGKTIRTDDDGEYGAARKLIPLLDNKRDGLLAVSRWFGGSHLGPARFDYIKKAAEEALVTVEDGNK